MPWLIKYFPPLALTSFQNIKDFTIICINTFQGFWKWWWISPLLLMTFIVFFKKYLKDSTFIYLFIMCIWEGVDMPLSMCGDHRPICLGVNSKDWIQVIGFGVRSLYLLSHLTDSDFKILTIWCHYPFLMLLPPNFLDTLYSSASFYERFGWPFHYLSIL